MTNEMMTGGSTDFSTGGIPAAQGHFGADAGIEGVDAQSDSWRAEVAARLERYRTRRKPRTPRYPSLLLPFDTPESWSRPAAPARDDPDFDFQTPREAAVVVEPSYETGQLDAVSVAPAADEPVAHRYAEPLPEPSAKVIEFPRSAAIPVYHSSPLADPVFDRPRIVEAPEILPPPPA
ncbi:MAG: hypothetical protein WCF68_07675 [Terriglobales bacterium]